MEICKEEIAEAWIHAEVYYTFQNSRKFGKTAAWVGKLSREKLYECNETLVIALMFI